MTKRRIGTFRISNTLLQDESSHDNIMSIMGSVIVVRAEQRYDIDGIEYHAISEYFDEVDQHIHAPNYTVNFDKDGTFEFVKQE